MCWNAYMKRIVSKNLGAKLDKYKFMEYPKKLLDIIYNIPLSKSICLKTCDFSRERICSLKEQWE